MDMSDELYTNIVNDDTVCIFSCSFYTLKCTEEYSCGIKRYAIRSKFSLQAHFVSNLFRSNVCKIMAPICRRLIHLQN